MSRLVITPLLKEDEMKQFVASIVDYSKRYTCRHQLDNMPTDQWISIKLMTVSDCKLCFNEYQTQAEAWAQGQPASFDHNTIRYITSNVSQHFPTHTFTGYSVGAESVGCRLDRYIIQNGKEMNFNMLYLDDMDWTKDYDFKD